MAILGIVAVTPALTEISNSLNIPKDRIGLVVSMFALPGIIFTPVYGFLADKYGRKKVIVPSLFVFGIFGTLTFFVNDFNFLLILRFLSGTGAASLGALNVTLIGDFFSDADRKKVLGYNNGVLNLGTTVIPLLGGFLAKISWNYVFILPSLAVLLGMWMIFSFKEPEITSRKSLNYFREFIKAIKEKTIFLVYIINILTYIIFFGSIWNYTSFIIEKNFVSSTVVNAVVISSLSFTAAVTSMFYGKISAGTGHRKLFAFVFLMNAIALVLVNFASSWYMLFIPMVIFGVGFGLNLPNMQALIIKHSPENQRGSIVSINRTCTLLGQFTGPLISGLVLYMFSNSIERYSYIFYFGSALSLLTLIISQFLDKE
ncbi:MAG: MFS transporter [Ignavibacteriae bacterium]|nr:MFS transporter [Ignavibacteriota bacterium]